MYSIPSIKNHIFKYLIFFFFTTILSSETPSYNGDRLNLMHYYNRTPCNDNT